MYVSSASALLNEDELMSILRQSQANNERDNITGLLLHSEGSIMQLIEGSEDMVNKLFAKIEKDPRHSRVLVLFRKKVEARDFPNFRMGFRTASTDDLKQNFPAYTDIVVRRQIPNKTMEGLSARVATFLRTFAKTTQLER